MEDWNEEDVDWGDGEGKEEQLTGVIILFDGQKQYPQAKVGVDFLFVEHLQFDCIEIIGTFVPFAKDLNRDTSKESSFSQRDGSVDGKPHQTIRMYISATAFYTKVIADKKAKDKKNRRVEQIMNKGSKLTQNIAVTILLGILQVPKQNKSEDFSLKIAPLDGMKFECAIPINDGFSPHIAEEKVHDVSARRKSSDGSHIGSYNLVAKRNSIEKIQEQKSAKRNSIEAKIQGQKSGEEDGKDEKRSKIKPKDTGTENEGNLDKFQVESKPSSKAHSPLSKPPSPKAVVPLAPSQNLVLVKQKSFANAFGLIKTFSFNKMSIPEALGEVEKNGEQLEEESCKAKIASSLFASTIDNIKDMFDFRAKDLGEKNNKALHARRKNTVKNPASTKAPKNEEQEAAIEKVRQGRYSVVVKPAEEFISFEHLQVIGREGPGGGPINKLYTPDSKPISNKSSDAAAKVVLGAAGYNADTFKDQKVLNIGGNVIPLKRTNLIPIMLDQLKQISRSSLNSNGTPSHRSSSSARRNSSAGNILSALKSSFRMSGSSAENKENKNKMAPIRDDKEYCDTGSLMNIGEQDIIGVIPEVETFVQTTQKRKSDADKSEAGSEYGGVNSTRLGSISDIDTKGAISNKSSKEKEKAVLGEHRNSHSGEHRNSETISPPLGTISPPSVKLASCSSFDSGEAKSQTLGMNLGMVYRAEMKEISTDGRKSSEPAVSGDRAYGHVPKVSQMASRRSSTGTPGTRNNSTVGTPTAGATPNKSNTTVSYTIRKSVVGQTANINLNTLAAGTATPFSPSSAGTPKTSGSPPGSGPFSPGALPVTGSPTPVVLQPIPRLTP
mmetsp:Transcript_263/g.316  ORF Transcript_263/g.316 Transcript_263/m.316 type:complete len:836 (-) Transcript_263:82-2589(-)|eukprot:CAMPEP_0119047196 /NCGR_PEP_ID=MMETSP1177-20130426/51526_1 /TAXON_ID=2985 /ORGANISM="Ochromonas sp, Strain CCMP1899" /LENGTH=835 /DNA_ID=CAMNT_0007021435 /DNA_START=292 /DNA_END=2802 /DNA_ORIENTATION=-